MNFIPGIEMPSNADAGAVYWFIFQHNHLVMHEGKVLQLPLMSYQSINPHLKVKRFLGVLDGKPCYAGHQGNRRRGLVHPGLSTGDSRENQYCPGVN